MSAKTKKDIKNFYDALGVQGLAGLLSESRHRAYLEYLHAVLPARGTILDLACGYGRLTIPLVHAGYNLYGLDLSPAFINESRARARTSGVEIDFTVGDMTQLPYANSFFDAVICMWSSFNELLEKSDQIKALQEMMRVIKPVGLVLIDMPCPPDEEPIADDERVSEAVLGGQQHVAYIHDEASLQALMKACGIKDFSIKRIDMGGIKRLVLCIGACK